MRILIELPTWLGDSVMTTPAIENLINYYSNSEIIVIGTQLSIEVFKNHPKISEVKVFDKKYRHFFKNLNELGVFDVFFTFRGTFRSSLIKIFISSKKKYQYRASRYQNRHQVEKYNDFINESLNINFPPLKLNIFRSNEGVKKNKALAGINPGAKYGSAKRWLPEKFAQVAFELSKEYDIVIFGGVNETDIAFEIENLLLARGVLNYDNLSGKTSIEELTNKISTLDLFITGDSGPMHIAAVLQIPTISIFGPTNCSATSQWMNDQSVIVSKNLDCQPCMQRECPLNHHDCMQLIEAEEVLDAVNSLQLNNY